MKFFGRVGFLVGEEETSPGIWKPNIVEVQYSGDVLKNIRRYGYGGDKQNPDLTPINSISIMSDLYARQNWDTIVYVVWNGVKWSVNSVEVDYPRIVLVLGEKYNENENRTT